MAGTTGLEPATSAVTGQRSNQLSYVPKVVFNDPVPLRCCGTTSDHLGTKLNTEAVPCTDMSESIRSDEIFCPRCTVFEGKCVSRETSRSVSPLLSEASLRRFEGDEAHGEVAESGAAAGPG